MKQKNIHRLCVAVTLVLVLSIIIGSTKETAGIPLEFSAPDEQTTAFALQGVQTIETTINSLTVTEAEANQEKTGVKNGILYDATDGIVLWEANANDTLAPASLTKLLTAYTALKYVSPETVFTVGSEQSLLNPHSSLCLIQKGHRLKLYDLLCGMLIASGNDAAYTIAVNTARTVYGKELTDDEALRLFYDLMNISANEIGMHDSHFCSPDGFDSSKQYTTVNDLLKLSLAAYKNSVIKDIVGQDEKYAVFESGENITWKNTNLLLDKDSEYYCPYATGLKTGTTENAGKCLIACAQMNGKDYIVIVMGCDSDTERYGFAKQMLEKL